MMAPLSGQRFGKSGSRGRMARIAVAGFHHETNSFVAQTTDYAYFASHRDRPPLVRGEDVLTWAVLDDLTRTTLEELPLDDHLMPLEHMSSLPVQFPVLGSGRGQHPFRTVADYEHFLARIRARAIAPSVRCRQSRRSPSCVLTRSRTRERGFPRGGLKRIGSYPCADGAREVPRQEVSRADGVTIVLRLLAMSWGALPSA